MDVMTGNFQQISSNGTNIQNYLRHRNEAWHGIPFKCYSNYLRHRNEAWHRISFKCYSNYLRHRNEAWHRIPFKCYSIQVIMVELTVPNKSRMEEANTYKRLNTRT
ncbi:hypothetical protein PoB_003317300 [Plakobranchus ocellatus]|uniref:Uncharacterized protein n=1 Tax=Plakobranchus ocellatus TaxID=259542 RepID=A0AAV4AHE7_9GAST|nr:hypothetical protein PoB_003317300 [Plakobranchus ocellatus]